MKEDGAQKYKIGGLKLSNVENLKERAFLIISDLAFLAEKDDNDLPLLVVVNLNKTTQILRCGIYKGNIHLRSTNMSVTNMYKILLYIEKNKNIILKQNFGT